MTSSNSQPLSYRLLKIISRQPIRVSRFIARILAGLVNTLKLSNTSKTINLNLEIAFPYLLTEKRNQIIRQAIRNEIQ
jgi:KDO2-lipid IV(A) lauroyltransferase